VSFDYGRAIGAAASMLLRFGSAAALKRQTAGSYDPATGSDTVTESTLPTVAVVFDYPQKYIDGTLILQGDKQAYLSASPTPKQGDILSWNGVDYTVIAVKSVAPAGATVVNEAQLRG
jgi:hypothetical protein